MVIDIEITGNRFKNNKNSFGLSFAKLINDDSSLKSIIVENPTEISMLIKNEFSEGLEYIISKHLSIDKDFALKLNLLDSFDCTCLEYKTSLGRVLKDLMIDNYQLVLTRKHWRETNKLILFFYAVEYGSVDDFIENCLKKNKSKKAF